MAAARLRALETGRWVVQAAPTGYSAIIDHRGRMVSLSGLGGAEVLAHDVGRRTGHTVLTRLGPVPMVVLAGLALAATLLRPKKT